MTLRTDARMVPGGYEGVVYEGVEVVWRGPLRNALFHGDPEACCLRAQVDAIKQALLIVSEQLVSKAGR